LIFGGWFIFAVLDFRAPFARVLRDGTGYTRRNTMQQTPLAHSIAEASERSGIGRTALYELINTGQLAARKRGRRTLILHVDLQRCLESLPSLTAKPKATCKREGTS
jgi:hypothetical protein